MKTLDLMRIVNPMEIKLFNSAKWQLLLWGFVGGLMVQPSDLVAQDATEERSYVASVVAEGAELRLLSNQFDFTEGPTADREGNVYFTDQPNDAIYRWTVEGKLELFLQPSGRSNGLFFEKDGTLLACADEKNELWAIDVEKNHRVLISSFEEKLLNGPNDLWVHSDGGLFFTDPYYRRPYWDRGASEQPTQGVYWVSPDRKQVRRVIDNLKQPNGIIGDADKGILYVADIGDGKTYRYSIGEEGRLSDAQLFCRQGSDGMTMDREGNVYLTGGKGVTVFDPQGRMIEVIKVPERWSANVTFGGPQRKTLFITSSDSLYSIEMRTEGM